MTGNEVFASASTLLGYVPTPDEITYPNRLECKAYEALVRICADLRLYTPHDLDEEIVANEAKLDALIYGVAMMLTVVEGDSASNRFFTDMYNAKRTSAKYCPRVVVDKLPKVSEGSV